jgi:hypothetical protein
VQSTEIFPVPGGFGYLVTLTVRTGRKGSVEWWCTCGAHSDDGLDSVEGRQQAQAHSYSVDCPGQAWAEAEAARPTAAPGDGWITV